MANVLLALLYSAVYARAYVSFLNRNYAYAGFDLFVRDRLFLVASFVLAIIPIVFYRGTRALSSTISVLIYLVLYVPIILTFALGSAQPVDQIVAIQLTFVAGMSMLFLADLAIVKNPFQLSLGYDLMRPIFGLTIVATVYVLFVYRGNLGFASFGADLYEMRADNEALGAGLVMRYLSSWLSTVLVPLCLAYGLTKRKIPYIVAGTVACVILYMAAANKISILLPFIYVGFYVFARKRLAALFPLLAVTMSVVIVGLVVTARWSALAMLASAVVLMRTIGNGGQITVTYYDFFTTHPQTAYSHVNGIKLFTQPYPYGDLAIGQVVGQHYWSPFMNANANFWATDGIAAMGLVGVIVVSVVLALVFVVMNSIAREYDPLFAVLVFLPFVATLLNQSLFSALWSGGALLILAFLSINTEESPAFADALPVTTDATLA